MPLKSEKLLPKNINQSSSSSWKSKRVWCLSLSAVLLLIFTSILVTITSHLEDQNSKDNKFIASELRIFFNSQNAKTSWTRWTGMRSKSSTKNQQSSNTTVALVSSKSINNRNVPRNIFVCYYTIPRDLNSTKELAPSHIDPDICTHIILGFASVVNCTLNFDKYLKVHYDIETLKKLAPKLKIMISVGGIDELPGNGFPEMSKNHANRKLFIQSVLNFTNKYNLDGLDIDWEFPTWSDSIQRERIYFVQLLQELRRAFDKSGRELILSTAVATPPGIVDDSYNVPQIEEHIDFINLMAYDYNFYRRYLPLTGVNAPLYPRSVERDYFATLNVNYSVFYWIDKGMPRDKIVVGIPSYGHSFQLDNADNHGIHAPAKGFGIGDDGFVEYSMVCDFIKAGGNRVFDEETRTPYTYKDDQWISFDDTISIAEKVQWIKDNKLLGAMIFSMNTDDFRANCDGKTSFPLVKTVKRLLFN